jgi:hypothetical protein
MKDHETHFLFPKGSLYFIIINKLGKRFILQIKVHVFKQVTQLMIYQQFFILLSMHIKNDLLMMAKNIIIISLLFVDCLS